MYIFINGRLSVQFKKSGELGGHFLLFSSWKKKKKELKLLPKCELFISLNVLGYTSPEQ